MELYLAVCRETNIPKVFSDYESLKEFSIENRYSYNYYKLGEVEEYMDVELFYYD